MKMETSRRRKESPHKSSVGWHLGGDVILISSPWRLHCPHVMWFHLHLIFSVDKTGTHWNHGLVDRCALAYKGRVMPDSTRTFGLRPYHSCQCKTLSSVLFLLFSCSFMSESVPPQTAAHQASLSFTIFRSLHKLMSIESVVPFNHLILCHPLLLLPSIFPSIRVFSNESALCISWWKFWSFSFNISTFNEYLGLISFRIDWFDLLAVQGTLKSLLQYPSAKASVLQCSAFFMVQLSHPYLTTGKTIAWTRRTFVGKVISLLFNMLSRSVIAFLPRSKCLLASWLQ